MNKQKLVLAILAIILVLSGLYSFIRMPRQQTVAKLTYSPGMPAKSDNGKPITPPKPGQVTVQNDNQLLVALLDPQNDQFKGFRRNLFKPIFREEIKIVPLPPPPPAPPQKTLLPSKPAVSAPVASAAAPSPVETAKQEMGRLKFLGFLKKDARKTIFLAEGAEIFLVRKGDKISSRYQVTGLTDEAITITVLADKSDLVFPLMESRALSVGTR